MLSKRIEEMDQEIVECLGTDDFPYVFGYLSGLNKTSKVMNTFFEMTNGLMPFKRMIWVMKTVKVIANYY